MINYSALHNQLQCAAKFPLASPSFLNAAWEASRSWHKRKRECEQCTSCLVRGPMPHVDQYVSTNHSSQHTGPPGSAGPDFRRIGCGIGCDGPTRGFNLRCWDVVCFKRLVPAFGEITSSPDFDKYQAHMRHKQPPSHSFFLCSVLRSIPLVSIAMLSLALLTAALVASSAFAAPAPAGVTLSNSATQKPITMCGTAQNIVLTDTPWIVYNMFYNQGQTKGSMCTAYSSVSTGSDGNKKIKWSAVTDIAYVKATYVSARATMRRT
jgi:hypothetical protein